MRLADFILDNVEPILAEWEVFARDIWPGVATSPAALRDHAAEILRATALDMKSEQSAAEQAEKSKGEGSDSTDSLRMDRASERHGVDRSDSGFDLWAVVAEYRALRASVVRLWRASNPKADSRDLVDLTRFSESIDQSLTEAVRSFTVHVEEERKDLMSKERSARLEAETANRAKDMFLATLSHELRTPLSAIVGWVGILRADSSSKEDLAEGLEVIERNTKAQVQLIEDVLDVSRIVSGKLRLNIQLGELTEIIQAGLNVVAPAAKARQIKLEVQLDASASRTTCDANRIQQVIWNLASNAVKFTHKGGAIRVTLARHGSNHRIQVIDNGSGIHKDLLPFVFDRFRQADSGSRRKFDGLGLGLSIVKHLVEMHGGTVEAASEGEGRGATFTVDLPIPAVSAVEMDLPPESAVTGIGEGEGGKAGKLKGIRVLVVDDQPDTLRVLVKVLQKSGAEVTTAGSAGDALKALAVSVNAPEILISDVGMPGQDGYDLIKEIRGRGYRARDLPAVALTGFAHAEDARKALLAGFQVHLPKPVDPQDLTALVASLTGRTE